MRAAQTHVFSVIKLGGSAQTVRPLCQPSAMESSKCPTLEYSAYFSYGGKNDFQSRQKGKNYTEHMNDAYINMANH